MMIHQDPETASGADSCKAVPSVRTLTRALEAVSSGAVEDLHGYASEWHRRHRPGRVREADEDLGESGLLATLPDYPCGVNVDTSAFAPRRSLSPRTAAAWMGRQARP